MRVVGIGQCSWDFLAVADSYPRPDSKCEVRHWQEQGGGPVATALVALARFGAPGRFLGVVGDDAEGEKIRLSLQCEGIETAGLVTRRHASSQKAFIVIENRTGSRTIFWQRPTGNPLLPEEIRDSWLDGCSFLHLDGLMMDASLFAAAQARTHGIPVMLDAGSARPGMAELAGKCDYLVASERFALETGWDGTMKGFPHYASRFGSKVVTVTLGSRGSVTFHENETFAVPAFPAVTVDTTGAGDVFHGGYLYGLLRGLDLEDTIRFASAAAALKCGSIGGRAGIPDVRKVLGFLADNGATLQSWRSVPVES
jgi:ribokinase